MILIGIILVIITLLNNGDKHSGETLTLSFGLIIKYFIAGMFASSAMLLPESLDLYVSIWCLWDGNVFNL